MAALLGCSTYSLEKKSESNAGSKSSGGNENSPSLTKKPEPSPKSKQEVTLGEPGKSKNVYHVEFSRDGTRLLAASQEPKVLLWDIGKAKVVWSHGFDTKPTSLGLRPVLSSDGQRVLCGTTEHPLRLADVSTDKILKSLDFNANARMQFLGEDKEKVVVAGGSYGQKGPQDVLAESFEGIWNISTGQQEVRFELPKIYPYFPALAVTPGQTRVVALHQDGVFWWDCSTGKELRREKLSGVIQEGAFSPDCGKVALVERGIEEVRVWSLGAEKPFELARLSGHKLDGGQLIVPVFSPSGNMIATAAPDGKVILWDIAAEKKIREWKSAGVSLAFAPDGRRLAVGNFDGTISIIDLGDIVR
jgi:WD40 repeat protein